MKGFLRIGHAGAGAYAPPNTLKSLALALDLGVDMVEFDVRPCRDALVLLHDDDLSHFDGARGLASQHSYADLRTIDIGEGERIPTLTEAIGLIKGRALMVVDLKAAGYEADVLAVLHSQDVLADVLISSLIPSSLRKVRRLAPEVKTSISYPEDRFNISKRSYLHPVAKAVLRLMRRMLPYRMSGLMTYAQADALTLFHRLILPATLDRVHRTGGRVIAWTVDDLSEMCRIRAMGVDGIITNRPALFTQLE